MTREKTPVRLSTLARARAARGAISVQQQGTLPPVLVLEFSQASGPAVLSDGRELRAVITPAELARVLGALPALSLEDDEDAAALFRVARMLRGEAQS